MRRLPTTARQPYPRAQVRRGLHPGVSPESPTGLPGSSRGLGVATASGRGLEHRRARCGRIGVPMSGCEGAVAKVQFEDFSERTDSTLGEGEQTVSWGFRLPLSSPFESSPR
jgi:hypothetical protein